MALGFLRGPVRAFFAGMPKWIWYALAGIAVLLVYGYACNHAGRKAQRSADAKAIGQLRTDLDTAATNQAMLGSAIARQNAAVAVLAQQAATFRKAAGEALNRATEADKRAGAERARADALAGRKFDTPCASADGDKLSADLWSHL